MMKKLYLSDVDYEHVYASSAKMESSSCVG